METFGTRLKSLRQASNLTLGALAQKADMSPQSLWNLENDIVGKTFEKLPMLAKALGYRIDDLFPEMDDPSSAPELPEEESKTARACGFDDDELEGWVE